MNRNLRAIIIAIIILAGMGGIAEYAGRGESPAGPVPSPAAPNPHEDSPDFDCRIHGNRICGKGHSPDESATRNAEESDPGLPDRPRSIRRSKDGGWILRYPQHESELPSLDARLDECASGDDAEIGDCFSAVIDEESAIIRWYSGDRLPAVTENPSFYGAQIREGGR